MDAQAGRGSVRIDSMAAVSATAIPLYGTQSHCKARMGASILPASGPPHNDGHAESGSEALDSQRSSAYLGVTKPVRIRQLISRRFLAAGPPVAGEAGRRGSEL
jgi:hypothetical protein